ncbi:MAG: histidine kinase [Lachnospiraceae bacterium]|nr:histidine kinase [Lachnospiraceae bacterium]
MNRDTVFKSSVTRKYTIGYILLSVIAAILLMISFCANSFISSSYKRATDELLELNELYVDVEMVNNRVNIGYLYLRNNVYEDYLRECEKTRILIQKVKEEQKKNYTREVIDTVCTMETYLEKTDQLMKKLQDYIISTQKSSMEYQEIESDYRDAQEVLKYISINFQEVYGVKLVTVQQTQRNIQILQEKITILQVSLLILGCLACLYYCSKVIHGVTFSLGKLTDAVKNIEKDVYQKIHVDINSNDEFEDFANALNRMIDVIQNQMYKIEENANIKEKLAVAEIENLRIYGELQKSRLTLLQSRINPHFLFNTLNMISSMAHIENAEKSAELMEITATYLRYNLDNLSKSVTLKQEIDNVKNYVYIQQYRFEERYQFFFEIDDECEKCNIPFMILQPLVENSLKHGLSMRLSGGRVWVRVLLLRKGNGKIRLEVEDNGMGMTESEIVSMKREIANNTMQSEHIGIRNIYMRLKLFYGELVDFDIIRMKEGLKIGITVPLNKGGK